MMVLNRFVAGKYFPFVDFLFVCISIIFSEIFPQLGFLSLLLGFFPWLLRVLVGQFPFHRTSFDWLMLIFLVSAAMGVWAAYNPGQAVQKFVLLIEGVLLFYALAGQPENNLPTLVRFFGLIGVGISVYFLLSNDWQAIPAKVNIINQIGLWWMRVRPGLNLPPTHPNDVGGTIAYTLPFLIAIGFQSWRSRNFREWLWVIPGVLIELVSFLLATSRGAAMAITSVLFIWLIKFAIDFLGRPFPQSKTHRNLIFGVIGLFLVVVVGFLSMSPKVFLQLAAQAYAVSGRLEYAVGGFYLFTDFPFTGGGLAGFPGLYSNYIAVIPHYLILSSHNLFLDIGIEQGILGMLAFSLVYFGCIYRLYFLLDNKKAFVFAGASFSSLVILMLHSQVDNIIYDGGSAPMVFLLPGMAAAVLANAKKDGSLRISRFAGFGKKGNALATVILIIALVSVSVLFRKPLHASWLADLGAVRMAKVELSNFPANKWYEGENNQAFEPAARLFREALLLNPDQPTANYRLGMIAMINHDYGSAVKYLEKAALTTRNHYGINKSLAYTYIWSGQFAAAQPLLGKIPDAEQELNTYIWWWQTHGRPDLSDNAQKMLTQFP